jgi:hypothetical protein
MAVKIKKWVKHPRGTKLRCPKCKRRKSVCHFKRDDPDRFCNSCRYNRDYAAVVPESEPMDSAGEIKLGHTKVLRVRVIGDVVTLVSGSVVKRNTRENDLLHTTRAWHVVNANPTFISDCSTLTVPLRFLDDLRAALSKIARQHPQSVSE